MLELTNFRERVLRLWRDLPAGADGRRPTQEELAHAVGLARAELNRRLHGKSRTPLSCDNVRGIVMALAEYGAIVTQDAALDLLRLAGCPPFADWQQSPLDKLAALSPIAQAQLGGMVQALPLTPSRFIGRVSELDAAARLLREGTPLLTISGTGGMGKTRFALELAHRLLSSFPAGAAATMLAAITDSKLVERAVAASLGVREEAGRDLLATLTDWLRPKQLLLVLDNCEHLLPTCAALATHLLANCPHLVIIATSRQGMGIAGETNFPLPPLALPTADSAVQVIAQQPAVQLLVERATRVRPGFQVTAKNAAAVATLSRQLEGIPLAIELAAPLFAALSVEQIVRRFDRFRLLRSSDPNAEPRQQTLAASIAWSYDRLSDPERALLRRLSVFVSGWSLEAVEAMDTDLNDSDNPNRQSTIYNLQSLISKSLVQVIGNDEQVRYVMLETIREYAMMRLREAGEAATAADWHADYYLQLAEQAAPELIGPQQAAWLRRFDDELGSLNAALDWLQSQRPTDALRLATAMWRFWYVRGYLSEGRDRLRTALATSSAPPPTLQARALTGLGTFAFEQSDFAEANDHYQHSLSIWRDLGDQRGIANMLSNLGLVAFEQSLYDCAQSYSEESLRLRREIGDEQGIAVALTNLGRVLYHLDNFVAAQRCYEEALTMFYRLGDTGSIIVLLSNFGNLSADFGDYQRAKELLEQGLAMAQALGDEHATAEAFDSLAGVMHKLNKPVEAASLYRQSLVLKQTLGDRQGIAYALEGLAHVESVTKPKLAALLLTAADTLRQAIGAPRPANEAIQYDAAISQIQSCLSATEVAATQQLGAAMSLAQVIECALKDE